jgi:hypothetical protein
MKAFLVTQSFIVQADDLRGAVKRLVAYETDIAYRQVQKGHADGVFRGEPEVRQIVDNTERFDTLEEAKQHQEKTEDRLDDLIEVFRFYQNANWPDTKIGNAVHAVFDWFPYIRKRLTKN